jgi:hypothetical protein
MRAISERQLRTAVDRAGLPEDAFHRILVALDDAPQTASSFEVAHVSYYLGGLLILGAMGWFIASSWDRLPGIALFLIALVYAALFGGLGTRLFRQPATRVPGGILVTVAVCMTPLAVYGLERQLGWWPMGNHLPSSGFHPSVAGNWVLVELATMLLALLALRWVRFPFLTAPTAGALWYLSLDVPALLFGTHWTFHQECWMAIGFGLLMLLAAYRLDDDIELDFAFWFYLFGLLSFNIGLTMLGDGSQLASALYCLLHLLLMLLAVVLQRKAFLVFGALGVFAYLLNEAQSYFRNSLTFSLALTVLGGLFIAAGILYKRNEQSISTRLRPLMPTRIRQRHGISVA